MLEWKTVLLLYVDCLDPAKPALHPSPDEGYPQIVIIQRIGIEHADGFIGFTLCAHGYIGKPIRRTALAILGHVDRRHIPGLREQGIQIFLRCGFGQIPYVDRDFHDRIAFSGSTGKELPPTLNRVGGYISTQIQLIVLNCCNQCTTLQSSEMHVCDSMPEMRQITNLEPMIQSNYLIQGRARLSCRQPYIRVGGSCLIAHDHNTQEFQMEAKLYVGNLSYQTTEENLRELFMQAGNVTSVALIKEPGTQRSKGFAFVEMGSQSEVQKAITMFHGYTLGERQLTVNVARPREERSGGGFRQNRGGNNNRRY